VLLIAYVPGFKPPAETSSENSGILPFSPTENDKFTLLCTLAQDESTSPYAYFLLGFDGVQKQISVTRLFPQTVLSENRTPRIILKETFDKDGAGGAATALNQRFSINISKYICFTNDSLLGFFDLFNSVVLNVPQNLSQVDKQKDIYIKIDKGRQSLSGVLLIDYIACTVWQEGNSQVLYQSANAVTEFIRQNHEALSLALDTKAEDYILSSTKTNLSVTDIENRRELISYLLFESGDGVVTLAVDGEFKNGNTEFHLDEQSVSNILSNYGI